MTTRDAQKEREEHLVKALIGSGKRPEHGPLCVHMSPGIVLRFTRHTNPDGKPGAWVSDDSQVAPTVSTTRDTIIDGSSRISGHGSLAPGFYPSRTVINLDLGGAARSA